MVLTTFPVLEDIAENVAGVHLVLESITEPGAEVHGYEPAPGGIRKASAAGPIPDNGLNFEAWFGEEFDAPHRGLRGMGLPQRVGDKERAHAGNIPPAQGPAGEDGHDEGDVDEPRQLPDVREVRYPQLVRAGGGVPVPLDQVETPSRLFLAPGGARSVPAADDAGEAGDAHQPGDLVPSELESLAGAACHSLRTQ